MNTAEPPLIWVGSYTADGGGSATGIGAVTDTSDRRLKWNGTAVEADSPSFLAVHPVLPVLYAVGEHTGTVRAYRPNGCQLAPVGELWAAGGAACHVAVDPAGRFLAVACWGNGQVLTYELGADGGIISRFAAKPSLDPYRANPAVRGRPSRAHACLALADGRFMSTDLGHDQLRVWNFVPAAGLVLDHEVVLPENSGPRHLVQHGNGDIFVVTEYSVEVAVVRPSPESGTFHLAEVVPATFGGVLPGDAAAEIALSHTGQYAYVGVRGSNRVSVLRLEADGERLRPIADISSGGDWPRHHLVADGRLHVANERSGSIATFALDPDTGLPGALLGLIDAPSPTALVAARA